MCRDNPYAANAKEGFIAAAVGTGIKPSSLIADAERKKAIQAAFLAWTDEADADGLTDFYGLQALAAGASFEAGECFIRLRPRRAEDGLTVPLQLQVLESELLPLTDNRTAPNGNVIRCGIEFNGIGKRVAYHFLKRHPGENIVGASSFERTVVPAADVLHLYRPMRPGQVRGQPAITPGMVRLYLLDQYDDAELDRKRVAAMFAGFITKPTAESENPLSGADDFATPDGVAAEQVVVADDAVIAPMEPGGLQVLLPGEDIEFSSPTEVGGSYEAFQFRQLCAISAGLGIPYHIVSGDLSKANYGSQRGGQVEFRRRVDQYQHAVLVFQLCRPVWLRWLEAAVLSGAVPITPAEFARNRAALSAAKWIPPRWEWIDPKKDREAQALAEDRGWTARSDSIEAEGYDPEEVDARIAADRSREQRLGLTFPKVDPAPAPQLPPDEQGFPA
jgi:lambda family phage portal protein